MDLENKVNQEENDDELHFILFLFILLIRQTASDGNQSGLKRQLVVAKSLVSDFKSQSDQWRYASKCYRENPWLIWLFFRTR